ncbi:hypothetical protein K402DRAFT_131342 [Aulographum hederae CBS 113979]|uniref:Uncharacterized protein n=1 Tax=Aulographum hederae CBS 113979 TaxID=1176131 RepID=A0A6G1HF80_9PEZI|nr:hypothetical protein K402DRAFT_131342 [Aulographum hederae CBS 113979]
MVGLLHRTTAQPVLLPTSSTVSTTGEHCYQTPVRSCQRHLCTPPTHQQDITACFNARLYLVPSVHLVSRTLRSSRLLYGSRYLGPTGPFLASSFSITFKSIKKILLLRGPSMQPASSIKASRTLPGGDKVLHRAVRRCFRMPKEGQTCPADGEVVEPSLVVS